MNRPIPLYIALMAMLVTFPGARALAAPAAPVPDAAGLQREVVTQGPMLLGDLRQAREDGLRGDHWGMTDSLQDAYRLARAMAEEARLSHPNSIYYPQSPKVSVPLEQRLHIDTPLEGGRRKRLGELDETAGSVPLKPVATAIQRALHALHRYPPAMGLALMETNRALQWILWDKGLEPRAWVDARDQVLRGFALAIDGHPQAQAQLASAHDALAELPGGSDYAIRLAGLETATVPDLRALSALVQDLDAKVQSLRDAAERTQYGAR